MASATESLPTKLEIRQFILAAYQRQLKPAEIVKECQIKLGPRAPSYFTVSRWYRRFQAGDFSLKDEKREGRPKLHCTTSKLIAQKIIEDPRITNKMISAEVGLQSNISQIINHQLNYVKHAGRYVPRLLSDFQKAQRAQHAKTCLELYRSSPTDFLERFIATGELCVHRKLSKPPTKPVTSFEHSPEVQTLWSTIIWHGNGILISEFYEQRSVNLPSYYFELFEQLRNELLSKCPEIFVKKVLFMQDIDALQADTTATNEKLNSMGFEVIPIPTQSPDLSPCDFFLFENLRKWLTKRIFERNADVIDCVNKYFEAFNATYYTDGLKQLESRWLKVIELEGDYIDDSF